jgi:membrane-bound serine protease (ClpP class)
METVVPVLPALAAGWFDAENGFEPGEIIATLILAGAVLLLLETFLPGLVAGILGLICLVAGIFMSYAHFGVQTGNLVLLAVTVGLLLAGLCWLKFFPESRLGRAFVSQRTIGGLDVEKPELLNQTGVAFTTLRPSGTALINGRRVDVVTEGNLIERGTPIKVIAIEGLRVVVRETALSNQA